MRISPRRAIAAALLALAVLAGCSTHPAGTPLETALVTRAGQPDTARDLVIAVPGALTSVALYDPILGWANRSTAVVAYRLPGVDGRPLAPLGLAEAGAEIADYVAARRPARVYLIGFSVGGAVVLEAASRIAGPEVTLGLMASARPAPTLLASLPATGLDIAQAAGRAGSLRVAPVWQEYYRTLIFGRRHFADPALARRSRDLAERAAPTLILPTGGRASAHGGGLFGWRLPAPGPGAAPRIFLYHGAEDTVFTLPGARRFAGRLGARAIRAYPGAGHLLFIANPGVFADIETDFRIGEPQR